jgi:hypothetical protein
MRTALVVNALSTTIVGAACVGDSNDDSSGGSYTTSKPPVGSGDPDTRATNAQFRLRARQATGVGAAAAGSNAITTAGRFSGAVGREFKLAGLTCQPNDVANGPVSISCNGGQGQDTIEPSAPGPSTHQIAVNTAISVTETSHGKAWIVGGAASGTGSVQEAQNMRRANSKVTSLGTMALRTTSQSEAAGRALDRASVE